MKKYFLITAFFLALAMVFTACPGGGDKEGEEEKEKEDKAATNVYFGADGGVKIQNAGPNNPLTLIEEYVRIYFDPPGKDFQKLRVKFTLDAPSNIMQQCAFDEGTWGGVEYLDMTDTITWEEDPSAKFPDKWYSPEDKFSKLKMKGICFVISDWQDGIKITVNEVTFIGVDK